MKEDILEQMVEDWFISKPGRFIKHNIKYRPYNESCTKKSIIKNKNKYTVNSDIDLLGIDIKEPINSLNRVYVFNCKSWQTGMDFKIFETKVLRGKLIREKEPDEYDIKIDHWKRYKEFIDINWCQALAETVVEQTDQKNFIYMFAVTKGFRQEEMMRKNDEITSNFYKIGSKVKLQVITIKEMYSELVMRSKEKKTKNTPEVTDLGRMIQLFRCAGILEN